MTDLYMGTLRGYRAWNVESTTEDLPRLVPMFRNSDPDSTWRPGMNVAKCSATGTNAHQPNEAVPATRCGCGYWGYLNPRATIRRPKQHFMYGDVSGCIEAEGEVEMHEYGFRAAKAKIVALCASPVIMGALPGCSCRSCRMPGATMTKLGQYYGVPVFGTMHELIKEFPPTYNDESPDPSGELIEGPDGSVTLKFSNSMQAFPSSPAHFLNPANGYQIVNYPPLPKPKP